MSTPLPNTSPSNVEFKVNGLPRTTPWSGEFENGSTVTLEMSLSFVGGEIKYAWKQWSDGVKNNTRTLVLSSNTTLIGVYDSWLIYDLNMDGNVDISDFEICASSFGGRIGDEDWNPELDFDKDGRITVLDLQLIVDHFGQTP